MKRSLALLPILALAACSDNVDSVTGARPSPEAPVLAASGNALPGSYMVILKEGANPRSVAAVAGVNPRYVYTAAVNGFAGTLNAGQLNALQHNPAVAYIEQDGIATTSTTQLGATWGLDRIDQAGATLNGSFTYGNTGLGVSAYIIDTGIDTGHSEFVGRISPASFDAFTDGQSDCNGHGTHVAGTVGGTTYGVAKGVTLVRVRVLDCAGSGAWSGVVAGIDWVVSHHVAGTPASSNMSLGGGASTTVDAAVNRMIDDGVSSSVAAGNGNMGGREQDACNYSPARVPRAITIGATTKADAKTTWSNYGACVDFFAPGAGITSAWIGAGATETNTISGTSMATPHVAGVAALYLQSNPTSTPQQVRDALYAATTKGVVTSSKTANNHMLFTAF
jgi:subtilisin family serine protease